MSSPLNTSGLRTMVSRWLVDACTIHSPGRPVFDADAGIDTVDPGDEVYDGVCRVRPTGGDRVVMAGDAPVTLRLFDLTLPWETTGIMVDQVVTITGSDDPHMIDRQLRVVDVLGGSDGVHRRVVIEDTLTVDEGEESS